MYSVCGHNDQQNWFDSRVRWELGDGNGVRFWEDRWARSESLKQLFPRMFLISNCKECLVGEVGEWNKRLWQWRLSWRRDRLA